MIFLNILLSFLTQITVTLGAIVAFGFLIALCNRWFYSNFGSKYMIACYVTGFIGTPVHECAHALFCLIFAHKINEIKLFQINSADGTLGYVNHSYNPRNIYQKAGNFFIGIAPIVVISALLYLFAYLIMPATLSEMNAIAREISFNSAEGFFNSLYMLVYTFFSAAASWRWWVFVLVGMFFALHMTLSKADIKGALSGVLIVLILVLIVDIILGLVSPSALTSFNNVILFIGATLDMFLLLSLIISLVACLLSLLYKYTLGRMFR